MKLWNVDKIHESMDPTLDFTLKNASRRAEALREKMEIIERRKARHFLFDAGGRVHFCHAKISRWFFFVLHP